MGDLASQFLEDARARVPNLVHRVPHARESKLWLGALLSRSRLIALQPVFGPLLGPLRRADLVDHLDYVFVGPAVPRALEHRYRGHQRSVQIDVGASRHSRAKTRRVEFVLG